MSPFLGAFAMFTAGLVTWKELRTQGWSYSEAQTYRMVSKGRFPKPLGVENGDVVQPAWRLEEVRPFLRKPFLANR
jgi:predicted DNA-binding transcriptional regulator AlpA